MATENSTRREKEWVQINTPVVCSGLITPQTLQFSGSGLFSVWFGRFASLKASCVAELIAYPFQLPTSEGCWKGYMRWCLVLGIVFPVHTAANASLLLEAGDWTLLGDCGCVRVWAFQKLLLQALLMFSDAENQCCHGISKHCFILFFQSVTWVNEFCTLKKFLNCK